MMSLKTHSHYTWIKAQHWTGGKGENTYLAKKIETGSGQDCLKNTQCLNCFKNFFMKTQKRKHHTAK